MARINVHKLCHPQAQGERAAAATLSFLACLATPETCGGARVHPLAPHLLYPRLVPGRLPPRMSGNLPANYLTEESMAV